METGSFITKSFDNCIRSVLGAVAVNAIILVFIGRKLRMSPIFSNTSLNVVPL